MLIDPFTVIAQIVNFAILVVALKYLLYDRVIDAMDRREASIASRLAEADEREAVATEEAERLRRERAQLDQDRHELMDRARDEAAEHRTELVDRARAEVNDDRRRWQRGLQAEQREFRRELERRTAHEVMELGRRALFDLADARLEAAVLDRALDHLEAQTEVRDVIVTGEGPLTVRTAFEVPDAERDEIIQRLRVRFFGNQGLGTAGAVQRFGCAALAHRARRFPAAQPIIGSPALGIAKYCIRFLQGEERRAVLVTVVVRMQFLGDTPVGAAYLTLGGVVSDTQDEIIVLGH